MQKRKLGKINIHLSSLGFGAAPIGDLFENLEERSCYNILENAYHSKINIFDTSPFYGNGLSEHRLGNFLKTIGVINNAQTKNHIITTYQGKLAKPQTNIEIQAGNVSVDNIFLIPL